MKQMSIAAKVPANAEKGQKELDATVTIPFPETIKEAVPGYCSEEALLSNAFANYRVTVQAGIRAALKRGESVESIQQRYATAKMGVAVTGGKVDAEAAFKAKFMAATPDERKKMIAQLRELAAQ